MTSARALDAARELVRGLASAVQAFGLYPAEHPNRREALRAVLESVRSLIGASSLVGAAGHDGPVLFVTRHSFYLGSTLLARESLSLFRLVESFEQAGIEAVEFLPETDEDDLDALVLMVLGERPVIERYGGIHLNRVRPQIDEREDLDLAELRRAYAMGLEALRETAVRVAAGREVDLESTTRTVERLADEVLADPAQALLLTTVKSYDEYTYYHMVNVCLLSIALGQAIGLRRDQVLSLGLGGLLHDVGKVHIPEDILFHVGKLSEEQWRIVQQHPVDGAGLIFGTSDGLYHPAAAVALEHHAAYDASGYPTLRERPHPSLPARLVAVADCFDAVTSRRAYRAAADRRRALEILEAGAGRGFDPKVVRVFVTLLGLFPVGSLVRLDTDEVGLVVRNHDHLLARPVVLIVLDGEGNVGDGEERDLSLRNGDGEFRWRVVQTVDADGAGIDVMGFLTGGALEAPARVGADQPGLVHEPSPGETLPEDYVDTHNHRGAHGHELGGALDDDFHPPIE